MSTIVTVSTKCGPQEVSADVLGPLWAVHPSTKPKPGAAWTVTHLPTGMSIAQCGQRMHAMAAAEWLQENVDGPEWHESTVKALLDVLGPEERERVRDALNAMAGVRTT